MVGAVFGTKAELVRINSGCNRCKVGERCADYYVALGRNVFKGFVYFLCQFHAFCEGGVHLPVACYNILSHFYFMIKFLSIYDS